MSRPFIFRINAAELFTEIQSLNNDEKASFITQFSVDLVTLNGTFDYSKKVIIETLQLIEKRSESGKLGGRPKSKAQAKLKQSPSKAKAKPKQEEEKEVELKEEKKEYMEKVFLTPSQYCKLTEKHGDQKTSLLIEKLSIAKCANNKMKYDSDYHAILKWVISAVEKESPLIAKTSIPTETTAERYRKMGLNV